MASQDPALRPKINMKDIYMYIVGTRSSIVTIISPTSGNSVTLNGKALLSYREMLARKVFGASMEECKELHICVHCKESPDAPRTYSPAGEKEYQLTGLCEICFDQLTLRN
jgi:hypothetical protein